MASQVQQTEGHPTNEEIRHVREFECRMSGHTFDYLMSFGHDGPVKVYCSNCGKSWPVGESDNAD